MKKKILIVDDEALITKLFEITLKNNDFEIVTCSSGLQALEMLRKDSFELAVLDVRMPGLSGLDLLRIIKTDPDLSKVKVIILTAEKNNEDSAYEIGADDFLTKPFNALQIIEKINNLLENK